MVFLEVFHQYNSERKQKSMKLGARILKTGIAITLALFLADLLQMPSPVFAGIAAIFAIQPTIYRSYLSVIEQVQGNIIGASVAVIFVLVFGKDIFIVGLGAIIIITILLKLKLEKTISLTLVTFIVIMETPNPDFMQFALLRFSTIMIGILSSFLVNFIFIPPKYETKLFYRISGVTEEILKWTRLAMRHASEYRLLKKDIAIIKERLTKVNQFYSLYKEERRYFKRNDISKTRKLVIYRQMIIASQKGFEVLKLLHRSENVLYQLPDNLQLQIRERLDFLMYFHEQLLLKFIGKVPIESDLDSFQNIHIQRNELMNLFLREIKDYYIQDDFQSYQLMHMLSGIFDYEEQLEHLEILINSFKSFHKNVNKVTIEESEEV